MSRFRLRKCNIFLNVLNGSPVFLAILCNMGAT